MKKQIEYTEEALFENYMVSSQGEEFVHSQIPFYLDMSTYNKMVIYSQEINRISLEVLESIKTNHKEVLNYFEDFPFKEKIFNLKCPISPMYWTRFDTFIDESNDIYFGEFNYDKPCGQKEMALAGKLDFDGNLNKRFVDDLIEELLKICNSYKDSEERINVGFLMDPCHYEEFHHSYYFKDIFKDTNINIVQVGTNNLSVIDGYVYGYSKIKLPIILRLFPTEFFYEIANIEDVLDCFETGNVLIINDPRIVAIQAKGFFAYLWDLVKKDSNIISPKDREIIKECIPYTEIFFDFHKKDVINNKDRYVIKSSLGRYSQEVYIGKLYSDESWNKKLELILQSDKIHIKQDFINMRQEHSYIPSKEDMNIPTLSYGNFGIYLIKEKVTGFLVRWSMDFLTNDNYTWMSPIGVKDFPVHVKEFKSSNRKEIWDQIIEDATFKYNFTGAYTNIKEYISLNSLIIFEDLYSEIKSVGNQFCKIIKKIVPYLQNNLELFGPLLGIPEELYRLVNSSCTSELCALGRIDFVLDNNGELKILEFNSETPAGMVESIGITALIKEKLNYEYENPNEKLREKIKEIFISILNKYSKFKTIKNIAVVTTWYQEDIYTSNIIADILREIKEYNIILGNVCDLEVINDKIFLYGKEIHAMYRHYPLDWFYDDEKMRKLIKPLSSGTYLINQGYTLITQSKAIMAIIYELLNKDFFSSQEEEFIQKYIPYTCLEPDENLSHDCVVKPYLSREGIGVQLSYNGIFEDIDDVVFQNRVNIMPLYNTIYTTMKGLKKFQYPVIGVYVTDKTPVGIYTRMGDFITNKNAVFMPTYIGN